MKQNVRFSGLNLSVDEQAVENGALAVCEGMELHNGALRPCVIEGEDKSVIDGEILYIHELTTGRKNAVFAVDREEGITIDRVNYPKGTLMYQDITDASAQPVSLGVEDEGLTREVINSITSNGNTLVLLTINGMKYFRWYENTYKYLGDMPELELEFSLNEGETIAKDFGYSESTLSGTNFIHKVSYIMLLGSRYDVDKGMDLGKPENLLAREEALDAALGKAKSICHKAKYFCMPFFIRYCYKLWDGRKVMHSAPVLMFSDITHPETAVYGRDTGTEDSWLFGMVIPQKLNVKVWNEEVINTIKEDWVDIIRGIDVYITPEISRKDETIEVDIPESGIYPSEGKWKYITYNGQGVTAEENSMALLGRKSAFSTGYEITYEHLPFGGKFLDILAFPRGWGAAPPSFELSGGIYRPQEIGNEQWKKRLVEQNAYYLLKRFTLIEDDIPTTGVFPVDDSILANIEAQEQMITSTAPDDYRTHNKIIAKSSYVYNNRVNLTGIQEVIFNGFPIYCLKPSSGSGSNVSKVVIRLEENGKNIYVQTTYQNINENSQFLKKTFLYYPDTRAKEMWIDTLPPCHFELTEHPLLNGAYHIDDVYLYSNPTSANAVDAPAPTEDPRFDLPNYIFTSASGNPFVYPAAHRYAVGTGEVKAIASTTRALSQGQFGQYPLIAFATDGIYALEVSSTGSYSGIQPISREVITNANALLQLDQSVAFITKRAISQLIESDVNDLSTQLSGPLRDLSTMLANLPPTKAVGDLIKAVQSSDAIYDFVNKRLLYFLMEDGAYTGDVLTFSANDNAWAFKSLGNVVKGVYNSYPYPYIHKTDGTLICLSEPYDNKDEGAYSGLIVSRTLKSEGYRNAIREFIQDYDIDEARPMLMLWGSDDNRTWHYIGKSNARQMGRLPGRIYKYFRLAVQFENLKRNDLYHGVTLDIVERFVR